MKVIRFENLAAVTSRAVLRTRHVVAALHLPVSQLPSEHVRPIGLQLPAAAFRCGGDLNATTLQGGFEKRKELPEAALMRWAREEYNLRRNAVHGIHYLVSTRVPVAPNTPKAKDYDYQFLHWHLLCTDRDFCPNPDKVESFMWCCGPEKVFDFLSTATRPAKIAAICEAVSAAVGNGFLSDEYRSLAELKSCHGTVAA